MWMNGTAIGGFRRREQAGHALAMGLQQGESPGPANRQNGHLGQWRAVAF
jgi:hypothetical protein